MPSRKQSNVHGGEYGSEAERFLDHANEATIRGLITGMQEMDRVQRWIEYEAEHQARKPVIGLLNQRKAELADNS